MIKMLEFLWHFWFFLWLSFLFSDALNWRPSQSLIAEDMKLLASVFDWPEPMGKQPVSREKRLESLGSQTFSPQIRSSLEPLLPSWTKMSQNITEWIFDTTKYAKKLTTVGGKAPSRLNICENSGTSIRLWALSPKTTTVSAAEGLWIVINLHLIQMHTNLAKVTFHKNYFQMSIFWIIFLAS